MADVEWSLRIAIGGASGLIGSALTAFLASHRHRVVPLVRRSPPTAVSEIYWDPASGEIDAPALEGCDAAVHLGGTNIAGGRWTKQRKGAIRDSRIESTRLLSETLAQLKEPPRTFICASATGYYGDRGDELLTEESPPGEGFLADVCRAWEAAAEPARQAGIRVVNLRTGIVLSSKGGALARMLPAFRKGLGGVVGSGRQYMSWIALNDLVRVIDFLVTASGLAGPVNAVAPNPVTNREFTRILGRLLRRPTIFPLPGFAVRTLFGEMGQALLLEGNRVRPDKLERAGFSFHHRNLEEALRSELGIERSLEPSAP
jgi:uncharacterized protein (TIGR01777 family)